MTDLARNKATVIAFYELLFNEGRSREAIELYGGGYYIHHNPYVASGHLEELRVEAVQRAI